jgi:serine/threonine protein kinase/tetratricopeptide (TPR) repeat protein
MINTRYEIIKKLGQGRSTVYLCRDIEFPEKELAIKILPVGMDDYEKEIFIKEYFTLRKLDHPNIIKAFEFGTIFQTDGEAGIESGSTFIILEYFDGVELLTEQVIRDEKRLREITKQICAALYYLHQSKYIYYDLKPENILVSYKDGSPQIRLIDLGLAQYSPNTSDYEIKGTAYYIAPELLKKENYNHSVDFYSLGIMLYRIIYDRFPFDAKSELDIYKSAIENVFEFPTSNGFTTEFASIVKRLLEKDIEKRYKSALAIIKDLGYSLELSITKEFLPARVFSCRERVINTLNKYLADKTLSEVYSIKGFDGVGKSSLLQRLRELNTDAVIISDVKGKTAEELIRYLLRQIIFSKAVYPNLVEEEKIVLLKLLKKSEKDIVDEFRTAVALLASKSKFILMLDDFNLYDPLTSDLLVEIIPLLQVNSIKVIVAESSEHNFLSARINNLKDITLGPLTKEEVTRFLSDSFSSDFPQIEIKNLITANADFIPGNIKSFIKDLILFGIMNFSEAGVSFSDEKEKLTKLTEAHHSVYDLRLANLSRQELNTVKIISALDIYIDSNLLSLLLGLSREETNRIITNLQLNNIIQKFTSGETIIFTSDAIKKYIYASIENKKELHLRIAKKISQKAPLLSRLEEARHYELAEEFVKCFQITMVEINEAEKHSAYAYMQRSLNHLLELPLESIQIDSLKIRLSEVCLKLGDVHSALKKIKELKNTIPEGNYSNRLFIIEGSALIAAGEYELGKKVITVLLNRVVDEDEKQRLKVELAYADFELKMYDEAREQCNTLLEEKRSSPELTGRCYNLLGMIDIYQKNDMSSALANFQNAKNKFEEAGQPARVAGTEVNIGNIYTLLNEYDKAEEHWKNASQINQSIGNLEQEGISVQNLGLFYLFRQKYDLAIESYLKAKNIFFNLGKENNSGLIQINLSEVYLKTCDYQKSLNIALEAYSIFSRLKNYEETSEALALLGKVYYSLGFSNKLDDTINLLEEIINLVELPEKYYTNLKYLKYLLRILKNEKIVSNELIELVNEYVKLDERNLIVECRFLMLDYLVHEKEYNVAYYYLMQNELMELCSQNSILEAEREYFLGIISKNFTSDSLLPPLVHFEKAYELIKNENISELTWKVLFEISEVYMEKGNLNKAKHFVTYTRELIYLIAERIESPHLRAAYLRQDERLNTLKKLENFYPQK